MPPLILAINAGSSSVKVTLYDSSTLTSTNTPKSIAQCTIDGLTAPPATLKYHHHQSEKPISREVEGVTTQEDAFKAIMQQLEQDEGLVEVGSKADYAYVCHRVVHGGEFADAQVVDEETVQRIERLSDLAPLHNTPALTLIRTCTTLLPPKTRQIAFFDTTFHTTLPRAITTYPINRTIAHTNALRKYGFHGLSYASILRLTSSHLNLSPAATNIIALHLGSGASACAIRGGKSVDTSMGLTPASGLPGATRAGSVDPSLVFHYTHRAGRMSRSSARDMHVTYAEEVLNKESGWAALAGTTDFGVISARAMADGGDGKGDEGARLAFDVFVDRILGFVGSYYVALGGRVDALVFAGGIGEKGVELRRAVGRGVECLGFEIDEVRNADVGNAAVVDIGRRTEGEKRVLVVRTDEQGEMARGCLEYMEKEAKETKETKEDV
ncbi:acetate kinase [Pseudovirgaria hyperparasitica]|uniref:Probable acetate kinase n=1 Tax=Pseudovirgaria hyperparasitica TaxID=470096 RepID=A0A6A6WMA6_9PEZI|nr:acetate kinase [Pseudovirgaria hyperparasitica]KAF2763266.1 acetate kinase [Pseudovirgaria hyperparasitica]